MKLLIPFLKNKEIENKHYLALLLEDNKIYSVILQEENQTAKIVGRHNEILQTPLEELTQIELIEFVDKTISKAEEVLPPDIETHKTVFGVKENWVDKESKKIKKDHLSKLKKVCDALDLTPIGFMVISEAISNLIQKEEGSPLSAILVDLGKKMIQISLFRGGVISESVNGPIEVSVIKTVDNLLKNFTATVLPAKILILNSKNTDVSNQSFTTHEWSKDLPFLHIPKITLLPDNFDAKAVAYGATQQMGFELVGISDTIDAPKNENSNSRNVVKELPPVEKDQITEEEKQSVGYNFGFVINEDVAKLVQKKPPTEVHNPVQLSNPDENITPVNKERINPQTHEVVHSNLQAKNNKNVFAGVLTLIPSFKSLKMPKLPGVLSKNKGFKLPVIIGALIILLVAGTWLYYYYGTKAQIILLVKPKDVTQETNIIFSITQPNDFSKNIISGKSVSSTVDGELSTPTTGKKDTGNKAKGNITIYNSSSGEESISSGTQIKSSTGITFTLDKDITIASASGDIFSGTKPGTSNAGITAQDVGTDANLPSGTKFTIGGNTTLAAKNDSAFSGGTKKTITVVSKADQAKLKSDLPKSLEKNALSNLSSKKDSSETILPVFINFVLDKPKFDKAIDDEAKDIKLIASVKFDGISYKNADIENLDKSILKDNYSQDISFADNTLKNEITDVKTDKDSIKAKLKITGGLLPKIDNAEVKNKLKGKSSTDAKKLLGSLPQVANIDIKYSPDILYLSNFFPLLPKNIQLVIKSND